MPKIGIVIFFILSIWLNEEDHHVPNTTWQPLFNGKDLSGWDIWLGNRENKWSPPGTIREGALGLNNDPYKVFSVVEKEDKPAIRISGQIFGALTSKKTYKNYHLKLQFKWGKNKWPPRDKAKRDSGLLYHCVGPHGAGGGYWMRSVELQIQEGDCGDLWAVAGASANVRSTSVNGQYVFDPLGSIRTFNQFEETRRCIKSGNYEHVDGQWNTIELIVWEGYSCHIVNGKEVMFLSNLSHEVNGDMKPLGQGKIQLQSEGAEIYYRDIYIKPLTTCPEVLVKYF